jgi:chromosomal replication initiator protein
MSHTLAEIAATMADGYGVTVDDIRGPSRSRRAIVPARDAFMSISRKLTPKSSTQIGQFVGRHHTTVLDGIARHEARIART